MYIIILCVCAEVDNDSSTLLYHLLALTRFVTMQNAAKKAILARLLSTKVQKGGTSLYLMYPTALPMHAFDIQYVKWTKSM